MDKQKQSGDLEQKLEKESIKHIAKNINHLASRQIDEL